MKTIGVLVLPGSLADGKTVALDEAERHHLHVRRTEDEAAATAFDGAGAYAQGTLLIQGRQTHVIVGVVQLATPPPQITLVVGAGDKDRFAMLAERCTELGVTRLVPLDTVRSLTVDSRLRAGSLDRIRRRAREACKQSGNPWATLIDEPCALADLAERYPSTTWRLAAATGGRCPAIERTGAAGWIVGPEGGLAPEEILYCTQNLQAESVSLGDAVLRFDTAAIAAAVITQDRRRSVTREG